AAGLKREACEKLDELLARWSRDDFELEQFDVVAGQLNLAIGESSETTPWSLTMRRRSTSAFESSSLVTITLNHLAENGVASQAASVEILISVSSEGEPQQ
ncbi:MAG: hypothetical protein AAF802_29510, partial [Planctomycetota bacterium]